MRYCIYLDSKSLEEDKCGRYYVYTHPHLLGLPQRSPDNSSLQEEILGSFIPGMWLESNVEELTLQE